MCDTCGREDAVEFLTPDDENDPWPVCAVCRDVLAARIARAEGGIRSGKSLMSLPHLLRWIRFDRVSKLRQLDFDIAEKSMITEVKGVLISPRFSGMTLQEQATEIVEYMCYERPDLWQRMAYTPVARVWYYKRKSLHMEEVPWFMLGGDEFGNRPWCFRIPFAGQLIINAKPRLKRVVEAPGAWGGED